MDVKGKRGFEDLDAYKLALKVVKVAYRVSKSLPIEEKYNLASQMRRASVSITLNIAEGYGRYHYLDSLRFYYIARGSLEEVLSAFIVCDELGYTAGKLEFQRELCGNTIRALNGYIRYIRNQKQGYKEYGERAIKEENAFYDAPPPDSCPLIPAPWFTDKEKLWQRKNSPSSPSAATLS